MDLNILLILSHFCFCFFFDALDTWLARFWFLFMAEDTAPHFLAKQQRILLFCFMALGMGFVMEIPLIFFLLSDCNLSVSPLYNTS